MTWNFFKKIPKTIIVCFLAEYYDSHVECGNQCRIAGLLPQLLVIRTEIRCRKEPPKEMGQRGGGSIY